MGDTGTGIPEPVGYKLPGGMAAVGMPAVGGIPPFVASPAAVSKPAVGGIPPFDASPEVLVAVGKPAVEGTPPFAVSLAVVVERPGVLSSGIVVGMAVEGMQRLQAA